MARGVRGDSLTSVRDGPVQPQKGNVVPEPVRPVVVRVGDNLGDPVVLYRVGADEPALPLKITGRRERDLIVRWQRAALNTEKLILKTGRLGISCLKVTAAKCPPSYPKSLSIFLEYLTPFGCIIYEI